MVWLRRLAQLIAGFTDSDCGCARVEVYGRLFGVRWEGLDYALTLEDVGACVAAGSELIVDACQKG